MTDKNPVEELEDFKKSAASVKRDKEHELWNAWNTSGRKPEHLEPLLGAFGSVVNAKSREWKAPHVNESAMKAEIETHMIKAFENYDPNRGASLRTHLENRIKKAQRFNTKNQNFAYIPEEPARFIGKINRATEELKEEYGRDPTHFEIADQVNANDPKARLSGKKVKDIIGFQRKDMVASGFQSDQGAIFDPTPRTSNREQEVLTLIQAEMHSIFPSPDDRAVFEHIYGINGKKEITSTNALAKQLGKSPSQVSRIKKSIGNRVKGFL